MTAMEDVETPVGEYNAIAFHAPDVHKALHLHTIHYTFIYCCYYFGHWFKFQI